jgi:hypothetical protein
MFMFVANGMHQNMDFQYRLPGTKTYRTQMIGIGEQVRLSGDLTREQVDVIIAHHSIYGMIAAKDISQFKGFHIPYVYALDNPVSAETIAELIVQNREYNFQLGRRLREEAAVAVSNEIEQNTTDHLKSLEMTIEEMPSKERDATFSEGIRITRDKDKGAPQGPDRGLLDFSLSRRVIKPTF